MLERDSSGLFFYLARDDDRPYVPPTKPYELSALATDLVVLARYLLKPGGRLVFFLPTVVDEYKELDLDSLLCDGMQVIANSLQDFGAWGRRVRCRRHFSLRSVVYSSLFLSSSQFARPRLNRTLSRHSIRTPLRPTLMNQRRENPRLFPPTSLPTATFAKSTFRVSENRLTSDH